MLEKRVIGLSDAEPKGKDLVVKIEVDGALRCFCKAKYDEAEEAGVVRDWKGGAFYIDVVEPADDGFAGAFKDVRGAVDPDLKLDFRGGS